LKEEATRATLWAPPFNPKADDDAAKIVRSARGAIFMVIFKIVDDYNKNNAKCL
jgi:hypothetical protein